MDYSAPEILRLRRAMMATEAEARAGHEAMMNAYTQFFQGMGSGPSAEQVAIAQSLALAARADRVRYLAHLGELSAAVIMRVDHYRDDWPL